MGGNEWWNFVLQLVVVFVGAFLGGGAVQAYLDWRRFRREEEALETERRRVAIDVIRAEIHPFRWTIHKRMSDKQRLYVYENELGGTIRRYWIAAEFIVNNLTDGEVVITSIEVDEPPVVSLWDKSGELKDHEFRYDAKGREYVFHPATQYTFSDSQGIFDIQSCEYLGWKSGGEYVTLGPKGTVGRAYCSDRRFFAGRKLQAAPSSLTISVQTTGGHIVKETVRLVEEAYPFWAEKYELPQVPAKEETLPEEEIPF